MATQDARERKRKRRHQEAHPLERNALHAQPVLAQLQVGPRRRGEPCLDLWCGLGWDDRGEWRWVVGGHAAAGGALGAVCLQRWWYW